MKNMSYIIKLGDIKNRCRICLTLSNNMISLNHKLDDCESSPSIFAAMESIFSTQINDDFDYPTKVCQICHGHIRIWYDLKIIFNQSQNILQRYVSLEEKDLDSLGNSSHLAELLNSLQKKTMVVGSALPDLQNVDISHNNLVALDDTSESQETSRGRIMQNKIIEVSKIKFQLKSLKGNKLTIGKDQNIAKEKSIYLEDQLDSSKDENNSLLAALPNLCSMKSGNLVMMNASITAHKDSHKSNNGPTELLTGSNEAIKFDRKMFEGDQFIIEEDLNFPKMVLKCSYCQEEFISNEKLAQHLAVCNRFALIKCDFCNRNFSSSASKAFHMKMKHVPIQPEIKCEICNLVFKNSRTLVYHQKTKHNAKGKTFVCELCGKSFYLKNGLTQHMDTHNKAVSKVVCPICGKSFHYKGALFYHMKMHTNEKNYPCTLCTRKFLNISALKKHARTHTGERPYPCKFCIKTFRSTGIRNNHEKTHTGVKSNFCKYCKKGFITLYSLKVHIAAHKGTQPCDVCKRTFLNSEVLKLHMKFKHDTKDDMSKIDDNI